MAGGAQGSAYGRCLPIKYYSATRPRPLSQGGCGLVERKVTLQHIAKAKLVLISGFFLSL